MRQEVAKRRRGATFFGGVLVLTVANLLVKLFGFLYKVPLNALLGDEMANVNAAYSVYTLLYMLSTAGIPVAVSVLVSRARTEGRAATLGRILRVSLVSLSLLGAVGSVGLLLLADPIAIANSGGDSYLCLLAIAPALFFICLSSVMRGYFQGFGLMTPTAVSGVIEAAAKTLLGLLFVTLALSATGSLRLASSYSVLAITVGIALGALYLGLIYGRYQKRGLLTVSLEEEAPPPLRSVVRDLLGIAVPIALSSGVLSLASLIDSQMMRPLLEGYYGDPTLAKAVFSDYSTGAVTLFNMPTVLVYPIASAIVPYITAARTRGDLRGAGRYISSALRIAALISLPAALGMSVLSAPILDLVFLGDADMAAHAAAPLAVLALSIFPLGLLAVTNAVLQSFGRQGCPILSMCAGVFVKITVLLLLTPVLGPLAAPLGTLLFYLVALLFNMYFLFRYATPVVGLAGELVPHLLSASFAAFSAYGVFRVASPLGEAIPLLLAIPAAGVIYAGLVLLLGGIVEEDVLLLPHGAGLLRILVRFRLIRPGGRGRGEGEKSLVE